MAAPNVSADARWAYASLYLSPLGRFDESSAEMGRAVEQDPLNAVWRAVWSAHLTNAGQIDRAIEEAQKAVELDEGHFTPHFILGEAYLAAGRLEDAAIEFEKAHRAAPWHAISSGLLAGSLYRLGDRTRSADVLRQMGDDPHPPWWRALYHLLRSEIDAAADWFEKMIELRDPFALAYVRSPIVRPLRESAHWPRLAAMMKLPD
jgi:tetratricopeptide (TPR) repeat protein